MESEISPQAIENFIKVVKSSQSKQQYMSRAREFDQRFVDAYPAPTYSQHNYPPSIPKSTNSARENPKIQTQIRNPFINAQEEKYQRMNPYKNGNMTKQPVHSRSQQNFYKQEDTSYMRDYYEEMNLNNYGNNYMEDPGMQRQNIMNTNTIQSNYNFAQIANNGYLAQQTKTGPNFYPQGQQAPEQNEYIGNLEEEPQYVQYYKKMIPPHAPSQKVYTPTQRTNPFKNN